MLPSSGSRTDVPVASSRVGTEKISDTTSSNSTTAHVASAAITIKRLVLTTLHTRCHTLLAFVSESGACSPVMKNSRFSVENNRTPALQITKSLPGVGLSQRQ